jgi:general secretion pathway protein A
MYQDHFGLHADPFSLSPSLRFLYRSQAHAETMAHLGYGLEQGEDIIMISGAIGTGKTLALQNLMAKVSRLFRQVLVNVTNVSYVEFLKLVLDEMGETWSDGADAADLLVIMKRRALAEHAEGRKILLVVDEAQNLDTETLEGVRLLTNLGQPDKQLFQIVLAGQPGLEELVERPELAQLRQRIRVHYRLEPLSEKETAEYIDHRTSVAGAFQTLFTPAAVRRIHELSGGIPRLVNHLAGHAMLAAYVDEERRVDQRHVAAEGLPETPSPEAAGVAPAARGAGASTAGAAAADAGAGADDGPDRGEDDARPRQRTTITPPVDSRRERRGLPAAVWPWIVIVIAVAAAGTWYFLAEPSPDTPLAVREPATPVTPVTPVTAPAAGEGAGIVTDVEADAAGATEPPTASGEPSSEPGDDAAPAAADPPPAPAVASVEHWVHVASFRDAARAERFQARLADRGVASEARPVTLDDGQVWLRVLVGPYPDAEAAEARARALTDQELITFHRVLAE